MIKMLQLALMVEVDQLNDGIRYDMEDWVYDNK